MDRDINRLKVVLAEKKRTFPGGSIFAVCMNQVHDYYSCSSDSCARLYN